MKELQDLYELIDHEMNAKARAAAQLKPDTEVDEDPSMMGSPGMDTGGGTHPVIQKRDAVDQARGEGDDLLTAHEKVYGDTNLGNVQSKANLSSTLGRVQAPEFSTSIQLEPEKGSILARDFEMEKSQAVTPEDMKTPMRGQVPNQYQTPAENAAVQAEELNFEEEYDYNDDVAYLQKYGRA